jgi:hypothetical protein
MYSEELFSLINKYLPPADQISLLFNVPIDQLDAVKEILQRDFKNTINTYNIRWRGPRFSQLQQSTLKKHATAFSVYVVTRKQKYNQPIYRGSV